MAVFQHLTKEEIRESFGYKALAFGCVPVYLSRLDDPIPEVAVRNWVPDWTFELAAEIYFFLFDILDPYGIQDRDFPFKITGEIK